MNPKNQRGWTEVIQKDVALHLQELRNTIAEVISAKKLASVYCAKNRSITDYIFY